MVIKEVRDKKRWFAKNEVNTSFFFAIMKNLRKDDIIEYGNE